jgi:hypothetical protein
MVLPVRHSCVSHPHHPYRSCQPHQLFIFMLCGQIVDHSCFTAREVFVLARQFDLLAHDISVVLNRCWTSLPPPSRSV